MSFLKHSDGANDFEVHEAIHWKGDFMLSHQQATNPSNKTNNP